MTPDPTSRLHSPNFDLVFDRRASDSLKWNIFPPDVLPMFVADSDFATPAPIVEALRVRADHPSYGYPLASRELRTTLREMLARKYQFTVENDAFVMLPGLVCALAAVSRIAGPPEDRENGGVIVPTPCYPPFLRAPATMKTPVLTAALHRDPQRLGHIDFDELNRAAAAGGTMLFLCNPHNPTGHLYSEQELRELGEWAAQKNITIVSDEIHCELILDPALRHRPIASISEDLAARTITLMAPSKTFNIPGVGIGFAIIPDPALRKEFNKAIAEIVPAPSVFGLAACQAAYEKCDEWRERLLPYLRENRDTVLRALAPYSSLVTCNRPEGTYLSWLDFSEAGWERPAAGLIKRAKVALGEGTEFGLPFHARLTFGCPRPILDEGLRRVTAALEQALR